jgi:hypothetical protein
MTQTQNYINAINQTNPGFKSMEQGTIDRYINVTRPDDQAFRVELVSQRKMAHVVPPTGPSSKITFSNFGDFGAKISDKINNWQAPQ